MSKLPVAMVAGIVLALQPLAAQEYRLRLDTRLQTVAYRGWTLDSVLATSVVVAGPTGGFRSPDGIAVECDAGSPYCTFFRPGPERSAAPVVGTVDLSVWGLGVSGLRIQAKGRALGDFRNRSVWPGVKPALQLLDGYAEYVTAGFTGELGRTHVATRLGWRGFDGARAEVRPLGRTLRISGYGGWALARGLDVPITSPELNPLAEFMPADRQTVLGGWLTLWTAPVEARVGYQREEDPATNGKTFERVALDGRLAVAGVALLSGGVDYDLAAGVWGTGDAALTWIRGNGRGRVTVGGRRYRPYFDLWSIWTTFSPVGYSAGYASVAIPAVRGVEVRARGETYAFDDAAVSAPLVAAETDGWRWSVGASMTRLEGWTFDAAAHQELGPGAASLGYQAMAAYAPSGALTLAADASWMRRPLEYRFDDAKVWSYGIRADYLVNAAADKRISVDVRRYDETRERDDSAQLSWNQFRINVAATLTFGSGADRKSLHPSILRIPDVRRSR